MDGYESEIARQSGGPFNKVKERKLIRRVAEHWYDRQRYSAERTRRIKSWIGWIALGSPLVIFAIQVLKATFLGK